MNMRLMKKAEDISIKRTYRPDVFDFASDFCRRVSSGEKETNDGEVYTESNSASAYENDIICFGEFGVKSLDVFLDSCVGPWESSRSCPGGTLCQNKDMIT
jgi:hypothetical protein